MKLGYTDRTEKRTTHYLPRKRRTDLFNASENTVDYCKRFFSEIRGLGNVLLVKDGRIIAKRCL